MAEEQEDDVSTEAGTEDGSESGTEGGSEGESSKTATTPLPPPTELHNSALFVAKYLDQKLDKLFAATEKITVDMAEMEKRLMLDLTTKIEATQNALTLRIVALENLTLEHGVILQQQDNKGGQQAHQLDELQNQAKKDEAEGGVKGTATPGGTESEASGGTGEGSETESGTESEAGEVESTGGETTESEEEEEAA